MEFKKHPWIFHSVVHIDGSKDGLLCGLNFAVKDNICITGHKTSAGCPDWLTSHEESKSTAPIVSALVSSGATLINMTQSDELALSLSGKSYHYGIPLNPKAPGRFPGGSSSGSASAVAMELVDFAIGTDTLGSVRVPASYCGIFGYRPTHGRVSVEGVIPLGPSFDTVGWFARDVDIMERVAQVLLKDQLPHLQSTEIKKVVILKEAFELAEEEVAESLKGTLDSLTSLVGSENVSFASISKEELRDWSNQVYIALGYEIWQVFGEWVTSTKPNLGFDAKSRIEGSKETTREQYDNALKTIERCYSTLCDTIPQDAVLVIPTTPVVAPKVDITSEDMIKIYREALRPLTSMAVGGKLPQLHLPTSNVDGLPTGVSFIARRDCDLPLMAFGKRFWRHFK